MSTETGEFGQVLRLARKERGYKLRAVAEAAGIALSYLHELETSKKANPSADTIFRLATALNLRWTMLMQALKNDMEAP